MASGSTLALGSKKKTLLAMKYNQRSQMQFQFTEVGKCGRNGKLWESLSKLERATIKSQDTDWELEDPDGDHHLYWTEPPSTVLVIKKYRDIGVTKKFKELTRWLVEERNLIVTVEPSVLLEKEIQDVSYTSVKESLRTWNDSSDKEYELSMIDLIICVGGDGTLLYTSSMFQENFPPIMSFHMGSLGFLTPFQFSSPAAKEKREDTGEVYQKCVDKVLKGGVSLTLRLRLECSIKTAESVSTVDDEDTCPVTPVDKFFASHEKASWMREEKTMKQMLVMNDLVVDRGPNPYLTNLLIKCNGRFMTTVQGDELWQTLGPLPSQGVAISMYRLQQHIMLNRSSRNSAWVSFDGRNRQEITKGDSIIINTCKWPIPSINNTGHVTDWFDSLAECLNWNVRKEQKKLDSAE